ncbi:MAG: PKD domain-containing protein [Candidatus Thermoplasmatota archaeon]
MAIALLAVIIVSLVLPMQSARSFRDAAAVTDLSEPAPLSYTPLLEAVSFPSPIDTASTVPEFPLVSRALMLGGGSVDAILEDLNGDGASDLAVAVSGANLLSIFFRQADGSFLSWPTLNVTLDSPPVDIEAIDRYGDEDHHIVVLQSKATPTDYDHFVVVNITSDTTFTKTSAVTLTTGVCGLITGNLRGDTRYDIGIVSAGPNPESETGTVEIFTGPLFDTSMQLYAGLGTSSIACGDFDTNGLLDLAISNRYDSDIDVFLAPFVPPVSSPNWTLSAPGEPRSLAVGNFNGDTTVDLAVSCESPDTIHLFYQSSGQLPATASQSMPTEAPCSRIVSGDMSGDGMADLLALSEEMNAAYGYYQRAVAPLWVSIADAAFPTGASPGGAVIGDLTGDGVADLAVASAGQDLDGSSIALYPSNPYGFSNSNSTTWTYLYYEASVIAVGDIDGDDSEDLVLGYPETNSFGYMLGFSGDMSFVGLGYAPLDIVVTDVNGDSFADVLTSNGTHPYGLFYLGDPSDPGSLVMSMFNCSGNLTDIATGDLNDDGMVDVVASTSNGTVEIMLNSGSSPVYPDSVVLDATPGVGIPSVAVGDFDSDGLDDIAYPQSPNRIEILLQDEGATPFSLPADIELSASVASPFVRLWSGDVTGDFEADIVAMVGDDERLFLFDHDQFTTTTIPFDEVSLPEVPSFVSVTDVTDDGHADVVAAFPSADLLFLYRQSGSSLPPSPSMTFVTGALPSCAILGDGTGDHRGDLLVVDSGSHSVSAWELINSPPVAHSGGPYVAGQGDPHQFNGSVTTSFSELPYIEYMWDFGDGNVTDWARDPSPVHQYLELGNFTVTLTVRDPAGSADSDATWIEVVDSHPFADFTWSPLNPTEGEDVVFTDATYSFDPLETIWWIVDGVVVSSGLEHTVTMSFDDGSHYANLTAVDSDGSADSVIKYFFVQPLDPELSLVAPLLVDEGDTVPFEVIVDERFGGEVDEVVGYEWDFSYDGAFSVDEVTSSNSTTHVFGSTGDSEVYTVAVRVTDVDGDANTTMASVEVADIGPSAQISLSVPAAEEGAPFSFVDGTNTYDGIASWEWTLRYPDSSTDTWSIPSDEMAALEFELGDGDYSMRLEVSEADGDSDQFVLNFAVGEVAPSVTLTLDPAAGPYMEFQTIAFTVQAESYDPVESYEWDFVSPGAQFIPDLRTDAGEASHSYSWVGNYTAKVRINDTDGSSAVVEVDIEVVDAGLEGSFDSDVAVLRDDPNSTGTVTFDASSLAEAYPDIAYTVWEFGDGGTEFLLNPPADPVTHEYSPTRDYVVNVTLADDDGNSLDMSGTLRMVEPAIDLSGWESGDVVNSGTPLRFTVGDDSPPLVYVMYSVDGAPYQDFETMYSISTVGWEDGAYTVDVVAEDKDGNIARETGLEVTIDDTAPSVTVLTEATAVYGGDKVNITIMVEDDNIGEGDVVLFLTFPGDDSPTSYLMHPAGGGVYYVLVELPKRAGQMESYYEATDLAGNSFTSEVYTTAVEIRFIDAAWPYLLLMAVAAALGTAAYFMREASIAVDETFVIYSDGRLLAHNTRRLKPGMDDQVLSGMFVAIQDFIMDSFKDETSFRLRKLDFGEKSVLIEKGEHLFLAVVLHGKASRKVSRRMKGVLDDIEGAFSEHLRDWDGDLDKVRGVNERVKRLYSKAPLLLGPPRKRGK